MQEHQQDRAPAFPDPGLLTHALDRCPVPIEVASAGRSILLVNEAWCALFGRPRDEVAGATLDRVFPEEPRDGGFWASWKRCVAEGSAEATASLARGRGGRSAVALRRTAYPAGHRPPRAVVTAYAPAPSPALASSAQGLAVFDAEGALAAANASFAAVLGYGGSAPMGLRLEGVAPSARAALESSMQRGGRWGGSLALLRPDGTSVTVRAGVNETRDDRGAVAGLVLATRQGMEPLTLRDAGAPFGRADTQHELRGLLTVAIGNAALLARSAADPTSAQRAALVQSALQEVVALLPTA